MGGVQSRPDGGGVRRMFYGALSADGWQSSTYGRLLLPPEATLKLSLNSVLERLVMSSTPRLRTSTSLVVDVDAATFVNSVKMPFLNSIFFLKLLYALLNARLKYDCKVVLN